MFKFLLLLAFIGSSKQQADIDIQQLVANLTVEEKCGQMTQITFDVIAKCRGDCSKEDPDVNPVDLAQLRIAIQQKKIGSILNVPYDKAQKSATWQQVIQVIQEEALRSRHKIPILYGLDSIHGANYIREATLFPQPLAMAATWNKDIAEKIGSITAMETKAIGVPWNFNPVFDLGKNPLWPRIWETYGEDGYLSAKMGSSYINGSQGTNVKDRTKVITCLKHYIGYGYPLNGRDRSAAWLPEIILRDVFLPPFAAGIEAGAPTVMINSGDVNGIPGHANKFYMTDILKGELKFDGFTVSDWEDVIRLYSRDKIAETPEDAVRIAVMAGLDMSMVPYDYSFADHCISLAHKDKDFLARVNDANHRILKVKKKAGLFDNEGKASYPQSGDLTNIAREESKEFNLDAARESIVLAKNDDNMLPLDRNMNQTILVTGPTGNLLSPLNGGWSYVWQGNNEEAFQEFGDKKYTVFEAIQNMASEHSNVTFNEGVNFLHHTDFNETKDAANEADVIVFCIGEHAYTETPGNIDDLHLSDSQRELGDALMETGKPIIVVYLGGRPRIITKIAEHAKAILIGFLPGNRGGEAMADLIFGEANPSGKLPITYPKSPNGWTNYDLRPLEQFYPNNYEYLFKFGHGLSYTSFEYSNLVLSTKSMHHTSTLWVSCRVKNTGNRAGHESVILFLRDNVASISRQLKQVKGFQKVALEAGEQKTVTFELKYEDLTFINEKMQRVAEPGEFDVMIHIDEKLKGTFRLTSVLTTTPLTTPTTKIPARATTKSSASSLSSFFRIEITFLLVIVLVFFKY